VKRYDREVKTMKMYKIP